MLKKRLLSVLAVIAVTPILNAQDLANAIDEATDEVTGLFAGMKLFLFALAAIVALYGGFMVYSKYQSQDQDAAKAAAKYGFGFIFLVASGFIVEAVFIN